MSCWVVERRALSRSPKEKQNKMKRTARLKIKLAGMALFSREYRVAVRLKMTVGELRTLWQSECKHQEKYMKPTPPYLWSWADCCDCALGKIPWQPPLGFVKNLCFLIWHNKILEKKRRT